MNPAPGSPASTAQLDALATGRSDSFLREAWHRHDPMLRERIAGSRVLVVGGAGSIGRATIELIAPYRPRALHVLDIDENGLAELVRSLRNQRDGLNVDDFRALPLDFAGPIAERYLAETRPFDSVLNFAAIKHVRSEKDVFSVLQMLDTNVLKQARFKAALRRYGHDAACFVVSTDKAANPVSLMGASKRLMEDVALADGNGRVTAARFANVAFSKGSLLESFLIRLGNRQPLAVPKDTRRYFVTRTEAAQTCVLAAYIAPTRHIVFPDFDPGSHLMPLTDLAAAIVRAFGFEPLWLDNEEAARAAAEAEPARGRYPILVTPRDTSGEKPFEEFVAHDETAVDIRIQGLKAITRAARDLAALLAEIGRLVGEPDRPVDKPRLVELLCAAVPTLRHAETGLGLDQRM